MILTRLKYLSNIKFDFEHDLYEFSEHGFYWHLERDSAWRAISIIKIVGVKG